MHRRRGRKRTVEPSEYLRPATFDNHHSIVVAAHSCPNRQCIMQLHKSLKFATHNVSCPHRHADRLHHQLLCIHAGASRLEQKPKLMLGCGSDGSSVSWYRIAPGTIGWDRLHKLLNDYYTRPHRARPGQRYHLH